MAGYNPNTGTYDPNYNGPQTIPASTTAPDPRSAPGVNEGGARTSTGAGASTGGDFSPVPVAAPQPEEKKVDPGTPQGDSNDTNGNGIPDWWEAQQAALETQQRQAASAWLSDILSQYGLKDLAPDVEGLVQEWGTNTDVISLKLKDTTAYKDRFAGLISLQQRGINDVANEGDYIRLESAYRQAFRDTGLSSFLGEAGSRDERSKIADIVGKYSLSVNEVKDRISDAQRVAFVDTPQSVRDAFRDFYGVDAAQLVEYTLDPTRTSEQINRQANAAIAGGYARQASLNIGSSTAEQIAGFAGSGDITSGQLVTDFTNAREVRDATKRLAQIENTDLTDDEATQASLNLNADATKKVGTLQSRERARFGGSSAVVKGTLSRNSGT